MCRNCEAIKLTADDKKRIKQDIDEALKSISELNKLIDLDASGTLTGTDLALAHKYLRCSTSFEIGSDTLCSIINEHGLEDY